MPRVLSKAVFAWALSLISLTVCNANTYANPNAPAPSSMAELPVLGAQASQHYSSFGPQNNLSDPDFKFLPQPVYLDKGFDVLAVGQKIKVEHIEFIFKDVQHEKNYTESISREMSLDDIQILAKERLNTIVEQSGYLCDASVVWHQDSNSLTVVVTPLVLNSIDITAKDNWQEHVLRHLLRVPIGENLNFNQLKSQLRLIHNNPDLTLEPSIEVIPYTHTVNFKLNAPEHKVPVHVISSLSNLDQYQYGGGLVNASVITNNVTGLGDSFLISPSFGFRSQGLFSRYELPLTARFRSFVDFGIGHIHPFQKVYDGYSYNNFSWRLTPGIKYTFFDRPNQRASVDLQMDLKTSATDSNADKIEREAIRDFRAGVNYDHQWANTVFSFRNEIAAAFDILGARASSASLNPVPGSGSQFLRTTGYAVISRSNLPLSSTLTLNTSWQYSQDRLPAYEQFCSGGTYAGRGYREVYVCGDSGALASLQWQAPAFFIPKSIKLPFSQTALKDQLQVLTFIDSGYTDFSHRTPGVDKNEWVLSTGFGARLKIADRIYGRFDLGFPLLRNYPFSNGARFHFGVDVVAF